MNMREIAKRAGVSTATVSRVLNGNPKVNPELRDIVNKVIQEVNYVPNAIARSMNHGTTSILGLILPDITNPFFPGIARGVEDAAISKGYKVILCNTDNHADTEKTYLRMLREQRVDGLILVSASNMSEETMRQMIEDIPVVLCDRIPESKHFSSVVTDHHKGIKMAVDHLVGLGHREIAMIAGPKTLISGIERANYFRDIMAEAGLPCPEHRVVPCDYRYESGFIAANQLLKDKAITAILCANDMMALGAMDAVFESGLQVPDDISVVGYDNIPFSNWSRPRLTTVSQPTYLLGVNALEILADALASSDTDKQQVQRMLNPTLIVRKSSAMAKR